jgi:hypothetical protein
MAEQRSCKAKVTSSILVSGSNTSHDLQHQHQPTVPAAAMLPDREISWTRFLSGSTMPASVPPR